MGKGFLGMGVAFAIANALCGLSVGAAQEPGAPSDELEEVVVTGTRIARRDFESASPIVSIDAERFAQAGTPTIETVLNKMPQFVPSNTSSSNNPGNDGQANLQLRGLPLSSTLVLADGRRLIPAKGDGVVDVSVIPSALIESVEIITGGASAVYGSDAVAGVVNFKLKKEFDGVEVGGFWGQTDRGDATQWETTLTAGTDFANGRGHVFGSVGYAEREQLNQSARSFARYSLGYLGPGQGTLGPQNAFFPEGSATIEEGSARVAGFDPAVFEEVFAGYGLPAGSVPQQQFFGFNADGSIFAQGTGAPGSVANFRGEVDPVQFSDRFYTYNFAPTNAMQLPLERTSMFGGLRFVTDTLEVYGQALYVEYTSDHQLAPTPATFFLPPDNPYVPADLKRLADSRGSPDHIIGFQKRLSELGPRIARNDYDILQVTVGLTGSLFERWGWDAYAQYGENDLTQVQSANALRSRIEDLVFAADGGESLCGGFNPFGPGSISQPCAEYIAADGINRSGVEQFIVEASLSGTLADLPAGELRMVVGAMYKEDEYFYAADPVVSRFLEPDERVPFVRSDIIGFNASDDIDGEDANLDVYMEASVPLLGRLTGVEALEIVGGYRHSEYDSAGGVEAYKAELLYRPVEPLRFRASFQHAVRAPSIFELYQPQLPFGAEGIPPTFRFDPCRAGSPERTGPNTVQVEQLCVAQGVPVERLADLTGASVAGFSGGNPDLESEEADTFTLGFVISAPSESTVFAGLQIALDWYRIEVDDAITTVLLDESTSHCFDAAFNPQFDPANVWCTYFGRDPVSGEIVDGSEIYRNVAGIAAEGVDLQVNWQLDAGPGELGITWLVAWLDSFERRASDGVAAVEFAGTAGGDGVGLSLPEWKSTFDVTWRVRDLSTTVRWRYVDAMRDVDVPEFEIDERHYFDAYASYEFGASLAGLIARVGVDNLTDEDPPIFPSWIQANTDPSQYDVYGRRFHVGLSYRF